MVAVILIFSGFRILCAAMRRFLAYAFCTAGMIGFYFICRFMIYSTNDDFGFGFAAGAGLLIFLLWLCERTGLIKIVEPQRGTWTPHRGN